MTSQSDSDLVRLAAAGDADAFTELVRRYRHAVYGYCYYRVGNFEDARDLCQETFILAYRKLGQLREVDRLSVWLRRIAANLCTRWLQRQREVPVEQIPEPPPATESPRAALVREALSALPDKEHLAVVLHYVDGLSYDEIAGFLEVSPTAVKGRLYRGREMLRREMLRMTQEAFGQNRLDEEFVLEAVRRAVEESRAAIEKQHDFRLARAKADQALELLDQLGAASSGVAMARHDALFAAVQATQDYDERMALIERANEAALQSGDPWRMSNALKNRAWEALNKGEWAAGEELLARARSVAEDAGLAEAVAVCDTSGGLAAFLKGDLERACDLSRRGTEEIRAARAGKSVGFIQGVHAHEAQLRALESLPAGTAAEDVLLLYSNAGSFEMLSDRILLYVYTAGGYARETYTGPPALPKALPTFDLSWPDILLQLPPQADAQWSTDVKHVTAWYRMETMIESDSDSITLGLGQFAGCLRVARRLTGQPLLGQDLPARLFGTRTFWMAPGVGIVKSVYEAEAGPVVTAELTEFNIAGGEGYLPLEVGNRWRYRWVEGEEQWGYRTLNHLEIPARHESGDLFLQRYVTCIRR